MNKELQFTMQPQSQSNWCWAANAASISFFYDAASTWTQCGVACNALMRADCCINPIACNVPWYLEKALTSTGNFTSPVITRPLDQNDIIAQIDAGHIIGVRIGWSGGGGHFVSIHGYNDTTMGFFLYIADPIYGDSIAILNNFTTNYQGSGSWTHSYYTKSAGSALAAGMIQFTAINENILSQAALIKESFEQKDKSLLTDSHTARQALTSPHDVYNIPFESLKGGKPEFVKSGFRIVDATDNAKKILDFDGNSDNSSLRQIIHSSAYNETYDSAIQGLIESQNAKRNSFKLSIVRQPELKVEAFWLHSDAQPQRDLFLPIITGVIFTANESYNRNAFLSILEIAAQNKIDYTNDLLGG